jgi:hypothetical protein
MFWRCGRSARGGAGRVCRAAGSAVRVYGRMSTEDCQDPVTSRARQREQAAALVAALADPDRGWAAIVIGEYERAFYGSQYASTAPSAQTTAATPLRSPQARTADTTGITARGKKEDKQPEHPPQLQAGAG